MFVEGKMKHKNIIRKMHPFEEYNGKCEIRAYKEVNGKKLYS